MGFDQLLGTCSKQKLIKLLFLPFKQGVALSCVIFILCIDPLIRNLNLDPEVGIVEIKTRIGNESEG